MCEGERLFLEKKKASVDAGQKFGAFAMVQPKLVAHAAFKPVIKGCLVVRLGLFKKALSRLTFEIKIVKACEGAHQSLQIPKANGRLGGITVTPLVIAVITDMVGIEGFYMLVLV